MRSGRSGTIALVSALALLSCLVRGPARADECPAAGTDPLSVASVLDGATLRLSDGSEVRLAGIEAPAPPLGLPADAPWPIADQARAGLAALIAGGPVTAAWTGAEPDRYGRRHAFVFAGGAPVAQALLGEGLARARVYSGEGACFAEFLAAEAPALAVSRGLWALSQFRPRQAGDPSLGDENGLYDVVEGQVDSVGHGTRMTFLDFGRDFRRDFTVMVPQQVAAALVASGLALDTLAGKRVRVRGVIEESGGPAIVLDNAGELVVIGKANGAAIGD